MKNQTIFLYDYFQAGEFFNRIDDASEDRESIFITNSFASFFRMRRRGKKCSLVSRIAKRRRIKIDCTQTREFSLEILGDEEIRDYGDSLACAIEDKLGRDVETVIFVWNGCSVAGEVVRQLQKEYKEIKALFFEISNIPGKIFVDPEGVNAQSLLYRIPSRLDGFSSPEDGEYREWKDDYIKSKKLKKIIPQAEAAQKLSLSHAIDLCLMPTIGYRTFTKNSMKKKLATAILSRRSLSAKHLKKFHKHVDPKPPYIFIPLQVSNDTQLLLNTKVTTLEMIAFCLEGEERVVIKPHPVEPFPDFINDSFLREHDRLSLTSKNTMDLIAESSRVCCINSTVGLEALILDKEVRFFGNSVFSSFNEVRLKKYVMSYLIDIDFFSSSQLSKVAVKQVYKRLN